MAAAEIHRTSGAFRTRASAPTGAFMSLALLILSATAPLSASAAELFRHCDTIQQDQSFKPLSEYFDSHAGEHFECLALRGAAFVFTTHDNFEECRRDTASNHLRCKEAEMGSWYPDLTLMESFSGAGKHFALFRVDRLTHGAYGEGYHVVYRVPEGQDPRGYRIVLLGEVGAHDQSDAEGRCADAGDLPQGEEVQDVTIAGSPPFRILNEGKADVTIRFDQQVIRCQSGQVVAESVAYRWSGDRFVKIVGKRATE